MKEVIVNAEDLVCLNKEKLQELIRCKDCVFWKYYCRVVDGVESDHVCSKKRELDGLMHRTKADDFCSWAERKEE